MRWSCKPPHPPLLLNALLAWPSAHRSGGDFLYDLPSEFERARVLVFTAGMLLRLLKVGARWQAVPAVRARQGACCTTAGAMPPCQLVLLQPAGAQTVILLPCALGMQAGSYSLARASLVVLLDAGAATRNHPANTLVREYYMRGGGGGGAAGAARV